MMNESVESAPIVCRVIISDQRCCANRTRRISFGDLHSCAKRPSIEMMAARKTSSVQWGEDGENDYVQ